MASVEQVQTPDLNGKPITHNISDSTDLKRKASAERADHDDAVSPKRVRHDERRHSQTPPLHRRDSNTGITSNAGIKYYDDVPRRPDDSARRPSATLEEKKRGKRLFGGLLNTLSQKPTNNQQKRRQEIERRQQERLQNQRAEDDQKREENLKHLRVIRMQEQIGFEEKVMHNRHSKMLWVAQYLKTKANPPVYYLPYELTAAQRATIDEQVRQAKDMVEKECKAFKVRKQRHVEQHGPSTRQLSPPPAPKDAHHAPDLRDSQKSSDDPKVKAEEIKIEQVFEPVVNMQADNHDDIGDVVVKIDEDTVIY